MRLIAEREFDLSGQINEFVELAPNRPSGCTVHVEQNTTDPIIITSFTTGGVAHTHFQATPNTSSDGPVEFGGPLVGPRVLIDWQNNNNTKRALFRFWDGFVRPFGRVPFRRSSETGIAPAGTSNPVVLDPFGSWWQRLLFTAAGDQNGTMHLVVDGMIASTQPAFSQALTAGQAWIDQSWTAVGFPGVNGLTLSWTNTGGVNGRFDVQSYLLLG